MYLFLSHSFAVCKLRHYFIKTTIQGPVLWHSTYILCLQCHMSAGSRSSCLTSDPVPRLWPLKAVEDGPRHWVSAPRWKTWKRLLGSDQFSSSWCSHLRSEAALCYSGQSCCLSCWHPTWVPVWVWLPHLPAYVPRKAAGEATLDFGQARL